MAQISLVSLEEETLTEIDNLQQHYIYFGCKLNGGGGGGSL